MLTLAIQILALLIALKRPEVAAMMYATSYQVDTAQEEQQERIEISPADAAAIDAAVEQYLLDVKEGREKPWER